MATLALYDPYVYLYFMCLRMHFVNEREKEQSRRTEICLHSSLSNCLHGMQTVFKSKFDRFFAGNITGILYLFFFFKDLTL